MLVAVQLSVLGLYLPPVFSSGVTVRPRRSFHCRSTLPCGSRASGALVVLVAVQLSVLGLYLPPVFKCRYCRHPRRSFHCRSRLPCDLVAPAGALVVLVAVQLSVLGLYRPPVLKRLMLSLRPRRSSHCRSKLPCARIAPRAHWWCWWPSSYQCWDCICPPVLKTPKPFTPPQTIISLPVQTAVCSVRASGALGVLVDVQVSSMHCTRGRCYCWKRIADEFCSAVVSAAFVISTTVFVVSIR